MRVTQSGKRVKYCFGFRNLVFHFFSLSCPIFRHQNWTSAGYNAGWVYDTLAAESCSSLSLLAYISRSKPGRSEDLFHPAGVFKIFGNSDEGEILVKEADPGDRNWTNHETDCRAPLNLWGSCDNKWERIYTSIRLSAIG